ncbi:unnamed protein product [Ixodes hexagonus]
MYLPPATPVVPAPTDFRGTTSASPKQVEFSLPDGSCDPAASGLLVRPGSPAAPMAGASRHAALGSPKEPDLFAAAEVPVPVAAAESPGPGAVPGSVPGSVLGPVPGPAPVPGGPTPVLEGNLGSAVPDTPGSLPLSSALLTRQTLGSLWSLAGLSGLFLRLRSGLSLILAPVLFRCSGLFLGPWGLLSRMLYRGLHPSLNSLFMVRLLFLINCLSPIWPFS